MRYAPTPLEKELIPKLGHAERMEYFLTRAGECEEIWSLGNDQGWLIHEQDGKDCIHLWNYECLANDYLSQANHPGYQAQSVSLERFVDELLPTMIEMDLHLQIFATPTEQGAVIKASALFEIFDRKMDSETYFLEG